MIPASAPGTASTTQDPTVVSDETARVQIAFFSMEVALEDELPTFSGGLGVLAGDYLRSAADLGLPLVGVTLVYRHGYFVQHLDSSGRQSETAVDWSPGELLELLPQRASLRLNGRTVLVRAWKRSILGRSGMQVPLYFLDTDLSENDPADRAITDRLYAAEPEQRLRQEAVLGLGGFALLEAFGHDPRILHMNEGHCSLVTIARLEALLPTGSAPTQQILDDVRERCVFTTHTPVPAGHDKFDEELVTSVLGTDRSAILEELGCLADGSLNMTALGMHLSGFSNAVSLRHGKVAREMFPDVEVKSITNGVHLSTWAANPFHRLFDRLLPGWKVQNDLLRYASAIDLSELDRAHRECKDELIKTVHLLTGDELDRDALTIGLARRATSYKRTALLFSDVARFRTLVETTGPLQVVCSGKAHPRDEAGKELIAQIFSAAEQLSDIAKVVFIENYSLSLAKTLCSGSDVWLNTPERSHEASGTSGMKAALNGVPSLSVLDGWWIEGCIEGVTGWSIGNESTDGDDASALYEKLEHVVAPLFYDDRRGFLMVMRNAVALVGSFFNSERMVREYTLRAYRALDIGASPPTPPGATDSKRTGPESGRLPSR